VSKYGVQGEDSQGTNNHISLAQLRLGHQYVALCYMQVLQSVFKYGH